MDLILVAQCLLCTRGDRGGANFGLDGIEHHILKGYQIL